MINCLIEAFYKETPAAICTKGSYIAVANPAAMSRMTRFYEGDYLFDSMKPEDVLKYQAHFDSADSGRIFTFPLSGFYGYRHATAVFERIMGRRFAFIFLSRHLKAPTDEDIKEYFDSSRVSAPPELVSKFLSVFLEIPEHCFEETDRKGLIDIKTVGQEAVYRLSSQERFMDCSLEISENREMAECFCMPAQVPMKSFLQMMILLISAAYDISSMCKVDVKLCKFGSEAEVRISTDAERLHSSVSSIDELIDAMPSSAAFLSICDYVAGVSGCTLGAVTSRNMKNLILILTLRERDFEDIDFKSRDQFKYFEWDFAFANEYISVLPYSSYTEK